MEAGGYRLQWVVPRGDLAPGLRRVVCYVRSPGRPFSGFLRVEQVVSAAELVPAVLDALGRAEHLDGVSAEVDDVVDVLVCAHGRRDVCCGSAGTALAREAAAQLDGEGVRVWRTSHLGGHRFAPTRSSCSAVP